MSTKSMVVMLFWIVLVGTISATATLAIRFDGGKAMGVFLAGGFLTAILVGVNHELESGGR